MIRHHQSTMSHLEDDNAAKSLRELRGGAADGDSLKRLRLLCLSRGAHGLLTLGRMFRRIDDDGNRELTFDEFFDGLKETDLDVTDDEARHLFNKFDSDNSGTIEMTQFLMHLRPPMADMRRKVIDDAFKKMDKIGDGVINTQDIRNVYNVEAHPRYKSGEDSKEGILKQFLTNFEESPNPGGQVTHEEFLNYYSAVSESIDNDCYFDLMMRQSYKL